MARHFSGFKGARRVPSLRGARLGSRSGLGHGLTLSRGPGQAGAKILRHYAARERRPQSRKGYEGIEGLSPEYTELGNFFAGRAETDQFHGAFFLKRTRSAAAARTSTV